MRRILFLVAVAFALAGACAAVLFVSTSNAQTTGTFLSFVSEPGDYIGQGQSLTFTPVDSVIDPTLTEDHRELRVSIFGPGGSHWFLAMAAPQGQELLPGVYEGATRWPFQGPFEPGLSFSGAGRGCNTLTGRFEVLDAVYGPFGYIELFHATFEQHCEGAAAALFGEVQIVNPPPPPPLELALTVGKKGTANRIAGTATVRGTVMCSEAATVDISGTLTQRASRFALVVGSFALSMDCSPTPSAWVATVSSQGGLPYNSGRAQVDMAASAIDPNYGVHMTEQTSAIVRLTRSRLR